MNTVTASFDTTVRKKTEMSQRKKKQLNHNFIESDECINRNLVNSQQIYPQLQLYVSTFLT